MALEKEARTEYMGSEIDKRNRNWDKVSAHLADYETLKTNLGATNALWIGNMESGSVTLTDSPFNYTHILIETSDSTGGSSYRGRVLVAPLAATFYTPIMYGTTQGYLRMTLSDTQFILNEKSPTTARITQIVGICKVK